MKTWRATERSAADGSGVGPDERRLGQREGWIKGGVKVVRPLQAFETLWEMGT
jgi:hypothetical protein